MFDHILVPVDGSDSSLMAARMAALIARERGGSVTALFVIDTPEIAVLAGSEGYKEMEREMREYGEKTLDRVEAQSRGVEVTRRVRKGSAYIEIVDEAKQGDYDLLVIGRSGRARVSLGSTAERVVRLVSCPTLVVGETTEET